MPATPTHARVEVHLTDDELQALQRFLNYSLSYLKPMAANDAARAPAPAYHTVQSLRELREAVERAIVERSA